MLLRIFPVGVLQVVCDSPESSVRTHVSDGTATGLALEMAWMPDV